MNSTCKKRTQKKKSDFPKQRKDTQMLFKMISNKAGSNEKCVVMF